MNDFIAWPKTPRLFREAILTEKIDGTNAQIAIQPVEELALSGLVEGSDFVQVGGLAIRAGSRTEWITPVNDNYGFAQWVWLNADELAELGVGRHFGEWWGRGIQRNYGLADRRFSLFNVSRWEDGALSPVTFVKGVEQPRVPLSPRPECCEIVPVLYRGVFEELEVRKAMFRLRELGSVAVPGFDRPEGIVVYHVAAGRTFKVLLENDESPKGE